MTRATSYAAGTRTVGLVGGASKASLARAFGVSWPCIDHIARGDNWNHVTAED